MPEIFVNEIIQTDKILNGFAVLNHTVLEDLKIMYDSKHLDNIFHLVINESNGSGYFFDTYFQYVVSVQFSIKDKVGFDGSISFIDCFGDTDVALDEYNKYKKEGWDIKDRQKFMECFQKASSSQDKANLKIKDKQVGLP